MSGYEILPDDGPPATPAAPRGGYQILPDTPASSAGDVAADVLNSAGGGVIRGAAGLPGLPGTVQQVLNKYVFDPALESVFGPAPGKAPGAPQPQYRVPLPTSDQTIKAVEGVIGDTYRPQTVPGQYAATVGEFIGGGARPLAATVGGLASEAVGRALHGTPYEGVEPFARAIAGAAAPAVAGRVVTPLRTDPARIPAVDRMAAEGVPLTAGQQTGNRPLQWLESTLGDMPGTGAVTARQMEEQGRAFNRAVAQRMGEDADMLTPDVMQRAADRLGNEFRTLSGRNQLQYDPQMGQDLAQATQEYSRTLPAAQRQIFADLRDDVINQVRAGQGAMPGDVYQLARSRLSRMASGAAQSDPEFSRALGSLRDALDGAMTRSISPADAAAWQAARDQWGNMRMIERAVTGAGAQTAQGFVSPSQLRTAVAGNNRQAYARGQNDLGELARAAEATMKPLPNSGTAPRQYVNHLAGFVGGAGGFAAGGVQGALAGAVAPALAGRLLMTRAAQAYLANRLVPAGPGAGPAALNGLLGYEGAVNGR